MDTMNIRGSAGHDELAELRNHKKIVGMKQLKKQLQRGGVARVYLAQDADPAVTMPLAELAQENGIEIHWVVKMHDLGRACSIDVGAAAAATLSES
jgi:large subunit ribosomal protein L7A